MTKRREMLKVAEADPVWFALNQDGAYQQFKAEASAGETACEAHYREFLRAIRSALAEGVFLLNEVRPNLDELHTRLVTWLAWIDAFWDVILDLRRQKGGPR